MKGVELSNGDSNGEHGWFGGSHSSVQSNGLTEHENGTAKPTDTHMSLNPNIKSMPVDVSLENGMIHSKSHQPMAVIGMSCRLPGDVTTPQHLWELCTRSRCGWSEIPKQRFDASRYYHPNSQKLGTFNNKGAHFLSEDLALFDAPFFSMSAAEATALDPQQRLALECTFEALESAGIPKESISGEAVGVFAGGSFADYEVHNMRDIDATPAFQATGNSSCMLSNRISYYFDCKGPSFTTDTACSSSLTALHLACQSLRSGDSKMAIVVGSHLNILPDCFVSMSTSQLFNDEGKSYPFDHRGKGGFARGEGAGVVILKPLDEAMRDNDSIRAVLVNTGINQDGKTNGITAPNGASQEALIRQVYSTANLSLDDCGFVEAHGTGTKVGDPIEARALHNTVGQNRPKQSPLYFGSVKSNIGHLEGASGIISTIKAAMMLERGLTLPNIHFEKPNPEIPMDEWNMKVLTSVKPWPRGKKYVSVCNYGFGGANAHAVLRRSPKTSKDVLNVNESSSSAPDQDWKLFVLSAASRESLQKRANDLTFYLEQRPDAFEKLLPGNIAYTLGQRRSHLSWRYAIAAKSSDELGVRLSSAAFSPQRSLQDTKIAFVCTGQGAQWAGMCMELLGAYPVFDESMTQAEALLQEYGASWRLLEELAKPKANSRIDEPELAQPACTAIQCALINLLKSWDVSPQVTVGHSSGEIGGAYAADMLSFKDSIALSFYRAKAVIVLKERHPELNGAMLAVGASADEIRPMLKTLKGGYATVACVNSPASVTVSGDDTAVAEIQEQLNDQSTFNRRLRVDVAYHSTHMAKVADDYANCIKDIRPLNDSTAIFHSSLTGRVMKAEELQPSYWVANLVSSVEFDQSVRTIFDPSDKSASVPNILVEIGPHPQLQGPVKDIAKSVGGQATKLTYFSTLVRNSDANETVLQTAASLYMKGVPINMAKINFPKSNQRTPLMMTDLPTYPWSHNERYWHHSRVAEAHSHPKFARNDLLGSISDYSIESEPTWRNFLRLDDLPWLRQHKMQSLIVFPMTGYLVMAMTASSQRAHLRDVKFNQFDLRDVVISRALVLEEGLEFETALQLKPYREGNSSDSDVWDEFRISSYAKGKGWSEHCRGLISVKDVKSRNAIDGDRQAKLLDQSLKAKIQDVFNVAKEPYEPATMYDTLDNIGCGYGPHFQSMKNGAGSNTHSFGEIIVPDTKKDLPRQHETALPIHPAFFDQFVQVLWPIFGAGRSVGLETLYMPSSIKRGSVSIDVPTAPGESLRVFGNGAPNALDPYPTKFNLWATRMDDEPPAVISFEDLTMTPLIDSMGGASSNARELCYKTVWEPAFAPKSTVENGTSESTTNGNGIAESHPETNGKTNGHAHTNGDKTNGTSTSTHNGNGTHSPTASTDSTPIAIVADAAEQAELVSSLTDSIDFFTGRQASVSNIEDLDATNKFCVVVSELHQPLVHEISKSTLQAIQNMVSNASGILWVVRGAQQGLNAPNHSQAIGLARSVRSETALKFMTLDLDQRAGSAMSMSDSNAIMDLLKAHWDTDKSATNFDMEYVEREGKILVPRLVDDEEMNNFIHRETQNVAPYLQPFAQPGRQLKLTIGIKGALDTLHFTDDTNYSQPLRPDEVEIEVKATGMNFKDIVISMGQVPSPYIGVECSGVISRVGSNVVDVKAGDRVMSMSEGAYSTYARCLATSVSVIPDEMTFESACTVPVVFCTAYYALMDLGRLGPDDKILIHAAAGGVGQASIILAKMIGAEIFATVGSQSKKDFIMEKYGIPENRIFYSRDTSFAAAIHRETDGKGVDVVINSLAGDILRETWNCLAHFGRFIEIGKRDILANNRLEMAKFEHNATFSSVDLTVVAAEKPKLMKRLLSNVCSLLANGTIQTIQPIGVYSIAETETAFRQLQSGKAMGKLVVKSVPADQIKATAPKSSSNSLKADATYVILGGTGGLGRSIAGWMASRGARHILLVSRSGNASDPKLAALSSSLESSFATEVRVAACDISSPNGLAELFTRISLSMPPIRGVLHAAMTLRDSIFERMTHEDYSAVVEAKVPGAWHLHNALISQSIRPDFLVYFSSVAGIAGNRGQASYAAANTFLDSFAAYQNKQHKIPATAINLAAVTDVGYLADNAERSAEIVRNIGADTLCEVEVHALIAAAINGTMSKTCDGHCITGLKIQPPSQQPIPNWAQDAKFKCLLDAALAQAGDDATGTATSKPLNRRVIEAEDAAARNNIVSAALVDKMSAVLTLPKEEIEPERSVTSLGLDSLVAIEVRNWIVRELEANLQVLEILSCSSLIELATLILKKTQLKF